MDLLFRNVFPTYFDIASFGKLGQACKYFNTLFRANLDEICMSIALQGGEARAQSLMRALVWADNRAAVARISERVGGARIAAYAAEFGRNIIARCFIHSDATNLFELKQICIKYDNFELYQTIRGLGYRPKDYYEFICKKYPLFASFVCNMHFDHEEYLCLEAAKYGRQWAAKDWNNEAISFGKILDVAFGENQIAFVGKIVQLFSPKMRSVFDRSQFLHIIAITGNQELFLKFVSEVSLWNGDIFIESVEFNQLEFIVEFETGINISAYIIAVFRAFKHRNRAIIQYLMDKIMPDFSTEDYTNDEALCRAIFVGCDVPGRIEHLAEDIGKTQDKLLISYCLKNCPSYGPEIIRALLLYWDGSCRGAFSEALWRNYPRLFAIYDFSAFVQCTEEREISLGVYKEILAIDNLDVLEWFMKKIQRAEQKNKGLINKLLAETSMMRINVHLALSHIAAMCPK